MNGSGEFAILDKQIEVLRTGGILPEKDILSLCKKVRCLKKNNKRLDVRVASVLRQRISIVRVGVLPSITFARSEPKMLCKFIMKWATIDVFKVCTCCAPSPTSTLPSHFFAVLRVRVIYRVPTMLFVCEPYYYCSSPVRLASLATSLVASSKETCPAISSSAEQYNRFAQGALRDSCLQ